MGRSFAPWQVLFMLIRALRLLLLFICLSGAPCAFADMPDPVRFGVLIEAGDLDAAQQWLDEGLDPNFEADRIGSGLMIGAWEGNIPMMELFLRHGADVNYVNARGEQALMHAAWKDRAAAIEWLLAHGAGINRTGQQWSALHYAVFAGHERLARALVDRGADVNARSPNGSSVLMMAAREGHRSLAHLLLERGADPDATNEYGDDALDWALRRGHVRIAQELSTKERFAEAAREVVHAPPPVYSEPAPRPLTELVDALREARAQGRPTDEVLRRYEATLKAFAERPVVSDQTPAALEITGRRNAPGQERARLLYENYQKWKREHGRQ
jgi:FOG: Ankyrin repeat